MYWEMFTALTGRACLMRELTGRYDHDITIAFVQGDRCRNCCTAAATAYAAPGGGHVTRKAPSNAGNAILVEPAWAGKGRALKTLRLSLPNSNGIFDSGRDKITPSVRSGRESAFQKLDRTRQHLQLSRGL